jgi:hypothetical protein
MYESAPQGPRLGLRPPAPNLPCYREYWGQNKRIETNPSWLKTPLIASGNGQNLENQRRRRVRLEIMFAFIGQIQTSLQISEKIIRSKVGIIHCKYRQNLEKNTIKRKRNHSSWLIASSFFDFPDFVGSSS